MGYYLAAPEHRPQWVRVDRLLGEHGLQQDTAESRRQFELRMEARRLEQGDEQQLKALRRGWYLGSQDFKNQMLEQMEGKLGEHHSGELHWETAELKAERLISEELRRLGWQEADLQSQPKNEPGKLAIEARVRRETTLPIKAIAQRIQLGSSKSANARLHATMNTRAATEPAQGCFGLGDQRNHAMG